MSTNINKSKAWQQFLELCVNSEDKQQLEKLLTLLLTITEREEIADRILVIKELLAGKLTQREIATKHEISIAKITRGSNELKQIDDKLIEYLNEAFQ